MPNLIRSLGYSLGKVHVGLISYLFELYREGVREPLESFLGELGVEVPINPVPQREWNSVDMAVLDGDTGEPRMLVEMKVDDHERWRSDESQTERYAASWPSCDAYLFVTLGMGEYFDAPDSNRFSWIRIRDFLKALEAVQSADRIIGQWREEVQREVDLQERAFRADKSLVAEYRTGTWNIYLLGRLSETLAPMFANDSVDVQMTCYPYGARPDTILNFGWDREPLYMEINYSGRLNLKIFLDVSVPVDSRREVVDRAIQHVRSLNIGLAPTFHPGGKIGRSKTIASFDVGLRDEDGLLGYEKTMEDTEERLLSILSQFYGRTSAAFRASST